MFNLFRKKRGEVLQFEDNRSAFAHACSLAWEPLLGALIPALVEEKGGLGPDGEQTFLVTLAGPGGGLKVWTCTLKESASHPEEGDLVGFRIVTIASDLPGNASLIGYLACRLKPVLVPGKGWVVAEGYTPKHIKEDIHF